MQNSTAYPNDFQRDFITELFGKINTFRIFWTLTLLFYTAIGMGAAVASFMIEKEVFYLITRQSDFSFWIVLIFEAAKIGTILVYGTFMQAQAAKISLGMRKLVRVFQFLLITLSFICSLSMVALNLDRPNLDRVKAKDRKQVSETYQRDVSDLHSQHERETTLLRSGFDRDEQENYARLKAYYEPKIEQAAKEMKLEMGNVVRGKFKGPRYFEFERIKQNLEREYQERFSVLTVKMGEAAEILRQRTASKEAELRKALENLTGRETAALKKIETGTYSEDARVSNRMVNAVLMTLNDGILSLVGLEMRQVTFVSLFSILIAILIELCIYITFYSAMLNFSSEASLMFEAGEHEIGAKKNF